MNTLAHNIRLYVIFFSGDEVILIAYYFQEITMTKYMCHGRVAGRTWETRGKVNNGI